MAKGRIYARKSPSISRSSRLKWAGRILNNCSGGLIDFNHPDAIRAAKIVGLEKAIEIVTQKHEDLLHKRLPGSYKNGKRK